MKNTLRLGETKGISTVRRVCRVGESVSIFVNLIAICGTWKKKVMCLKFIMIFCYYYVAMEDAHTTVLKIGPDGESAFFAVYDGHGGQTAAKFSGEELHNFIVNESNYASEDFGAAIKAGYLEADKALRQKPEMINDSSGCTAVSVLLTKDGTIYCGNAGDSRCIISSKGNAVALSHDHKPSDETEFNRITSGGGYIEFGRVNGNLALSRAIGDYEFKNNEALPAERQIVTADPDVVKHEVSADDEYLVIACDGIWDCMTNQQVVQFVHSKIAAGNKLDQICEGMMDECLAGATQLGGVGCDNMTVVIVALLRGKTEDEWYAHVKKVAEEANLTSSPIIKKSGKRGDRDKPDDDAILNTIISRVVQDSPHEFMEEDGHEDGGGTKQQPDEEDVICVVEKAPPPHIDTKADAPDSDIAAAAAKVATEAEVAAGATTAAAAGAAAATADVAPKDESKKESPTEQGAAAAASAGDQKENAN